MQSISSMVNNFLATPPLLQLPIRFEIKSKPDLVNKYQVGRVEIIPHTFHKSVTHRNENDGHIWICVQQAAYKC